MNIVRSLSFFLAVSGMVFFTPLYSSVQTDAGSICIGPAAISNKLRQARGLELSEPQINWAVQIDQGPVIKTQTDASTQYPDLSRNDRHLVKIYRDGKMTESFWFRFEDTREYCLWFKSLYETWSLWPAKDSMHLCDCRSHH